MNRQHLQRLQNEGKIRGFTLPPPKKKKLHPHIPRPKPKQLQWMELNLLYWCNEKALSLETEYRFDTHRHFRFDIAITAMKLGIEYEGLFSEKSRHTTYKGYTGDTEKYNLANTLGYQVLRYTAINYKNVVADVQRIFETFINDETFGTTN